MRFFGYSERETYDQVITMNAVESNSVSGVTQFLGNNTDVIIVSIYGNFQWVWD